VIVSPRKFSRSGYGDVVAANRSRIPAKCSAALLRKPNLDAGNARDNDFRQVWLYTHALCVCQPMPALHFGIHVRRLLLARRQLSSANAVVPYEGDLSFHPLADN
jgi:hypothetical protein